MSLQPLQLPGFTHEIGTTGVVSLEGGLDAVLSRFRKTVRNEISRTYRDSSLSFKTSPSVSDDGYALLCRFFRARGMTAFPRSTYGGCVEFLAYMEGEPVSGILLYPSTPVPMVAAIFSSRRYVGKGEDYKRIGYASKRVMAEVCQWGIEHGMSGIDLASLDPHSTTVPGIAEYKSSFAPMVVNRHIYIYASPPFRFFEGLMLRYRAFQRHLSLNAFR